jgi:CTP synthase
VRTNFIFVTGGVSSGIGKGITAASIAKVLQSKGFKIAPVKIDPYLNFDAGTLRPTEHGEVWVTDDGGEIDQDLGHYERFLDINVPKEHNITSGQVYSAVIEKERKGEYLGQTVEAIPHVVDEIINRLKKIAEKTQADFVLVEIGGTVGEYQNELFYRAARIMKTRGEKVIFIHTVYLPVLPHLGEMKTKPAQQSVELLGKLGIQPDFLMCRGPKEVDEPRIKKLEIFCNVPRENIISAHDIEPVYELPLLLEKQMLGDKILKAFNLEPRPSDLNAWKAVVERIKNATRTVKVGIVGKYFDIGEYKLADSYVSVIEAVKHACAHNDVKPEILWIDAKDFEKDSSKLSILSNLDGVIVPGGFGPSGVEGKILAIKYVRENDIPFLGLCYGLQLAVVECARNVCGLEGAHTTEVNPNTPHPVIDLLPWQKEILARAQYGATMRLGGQIVLIEENTLAHRLYGTTKVVERFRHRWEINPAYVEVIEKGGLHFSGKSEKEQNIMQIGERREHRFFIGSQFHPEFTSRPLRPNPLFFGFIKAAAEK